MWVIEYTLAMQKGAIRLSLLSPNASIFSQELPSLKVHTMKYLITSLRIIPLSRLALVISILTSLACENLDQSLDSRHKHGIPASISDPYGTAEYTLKLAHMGYDEASTTAAFMQHAGCKTKENFLNNQCDKYPVKVYPTVWHESIRSCHNKSDGEKLDNGAICQEWTFCSATFAHKPQWSEAIIITAAHCFDEFFYQIFGDLFARNVIKNDEIFFYLKNAQGQKIYVDAVKKHSNYEKNNQKPGGGNDIAVMTLRESNLDQLSQKYGLNPIHIFQGNLDLPTLEKDLNTITRNIVHQVVPDKNDESSDPYTYDWKGHGLDLNTLEGTGRSVVTAGYGIRNSFLKEDYIDQGNQDLRWNTMRLVKLSTTPEYTTPYANLLVSLSKSIIPGFSQCEGDSGGPVKLIDSEKNISGLIGITITASDPCKGGYNFSTHLGPYLDDKWFQKSIDELRNAVP